MGAKVLEAQGTLEFLVCPATTLPQARLGLPQDS